MNALLRQIPNILTALRLVAAPLTAWLILDDATSRRCASSCFAGLSDALDGFLAKRFALTSRFGAWLDPAADKLLMLASFVTLTMVRRGAALADGAGDRARRGDRAGRAAGAAAGCAAADRAADDRQGEHGGAGRLCRAGPAAACRGS